MNMSIPYFVQPQFTRQNKCKKKKKKRNNVQKYKFKSLKCKG